MTIYNTNVNEFFILRFEIETVRIMDASKWINTQECNKMEFFPNENEFAVEMERDTPFVCSAEHIYEVVEHANDPIPFFEEIHEYCVHAHRY